MPKQTAKEIMARSEMTLSPETNIYRAMKSLSKHRLLGASVVDADGRLVGILTEKDCLKVLAGEAFDGLPEGRVLDYMTRDVETMRPTTSLFEIVQRFLGRTYRQLPVVDDRGRVIGQLTRHDAVRAIESIRDNSYLYGSKDEHPPEARGVDSAMRMARAQSKAHSTHRHGRRLATRVGAI